MEAPVLSASVFHADYTEALPRFLAYTFGTGQSGMGLLSTKNVYSITIGLSFVHLLSTRKDILDVTHEERSRIPYDGISE